MMDVLASLPAILLVALVASASPGPATLAIATTAMARGAGPAMRLAAGVLTGSLFWSISAAAGLAALALQYGWMIETVRVIGGLYLLWLAFKAARAAWRGGMTQTGIAVDRGAYRRGLLLHLTNPKAYLFFGALYAMILSPETQAGGLAIVVAAVGAQSAVVFLGYAVLFSRAGPRAFYRRAARTIHGVSALAFAGLGFSVLAQRLT
ncbi:LysE family transporter [Sulfitobacter sp. TSTF-M16]|uniref:LysE family transporter n=1 Tax=Sulfitobacter aestuariivivens TaxID=2766981 RepID=A0A927D0P9_9RHOB|nr:LysE family transporter [Sulfitobacter aestuariivivens]